MEGRCGHHPGQCSLFPLRRWWGGDVLVLSADLPPGREQGQAGTAVLTWGESLELRPGPHCSTDLCT